MRGERWWRTGERHEPPVPAARVRPHPTVPGAAVSRVQWQSPAKPGRPARQRAVIQLCWAGCAVVATGCWAAGGATVGAAGWAVLLGAGEAAWAVLLGAGAGAAGDAALASDACTSLSVTTWGGLVVTIVADNLSPW